MTMPDWPAAARRGCVLAVLVVMMAATPAAAASGWSIVPSPITGTTTGATLTGVSCTSANSCTAVGSSVNRAGSAIAALAERWNGSAWSSEPIPDPTADAPAQLTGVSCTSPSACTAVGSFSNVYAGGAVVERWDGTNWSDEYQLNDNGDNSEPAFDAVSCSTASSCVAVGSRATYQTDGVYPLAAGWNGKFWALLGTYVPPGYGNPGGGSETTTSTDTDLTGVSCTAPDQCTLVGYADLYYGGNETLAERWNGRGWAKQRPRSTPLAEVSCMSSTSCMAVAGGYSQLWAGTGWSDVPLTSPTKTNLTALSCPETRTCVAIGTTSTGRVLAQRWNGKRWSTQPAPTPHAAKHIDINSLSCASNRACIAVGAYRNEGGTMVPLVERYADK
jgi:hypothetical protein